MLLPVIRLKCPATGTAWMRYWGCLQISIKRSVCNVEAASLRALFHSDPVISELYANVFSSLLYLPFQSCSVKVYDKATRCFWRASYSKVIGAAVGTLSHQLEQTFNFRTTIIRSIAESSVTLVQHVFNIPNASSYTVTHVRDYLWSCFNVVNQEYIMQWM